MAQITLFNELKNDYNNEKEHPEKFIAVLEEAEEDNKTLLSSFGIKLKPSAWSVLTIEPELLNKTLLRAKELGFLEAYQQNAAYLKQDVDKVIKRIGELEAYGIPYKNEKGKYQSFLFSQRGYNYVISQATGRVPQSIEEPETANVDISQIKEYADRVMETFSLTSEADNVYSRLQELATSGLSAKEILMEIFKTYGDNLEYLSSNIDEIMEKEEEKMGRVA